MFKKLASGIKTVFQKGLIHILAGSFMTKLVAMFGSIFLVRILSKTEYGVLSYLDNIYGYVHVLAGMGMANVVLRYVVLGKTPQKKYGYFCHAFSRAWIWNGAMIVLAAVLFWFYPHKAEYEGYTWLLNILFLMLPLQNVTELLLNNERAMFANQRYAIFSLALSVSVIAGKIASGALAGIRAVVFGQLIIYGVMALLLYLSSKKRYYRGLQPERLQKPDRAETNKYALQYMITNGLWAVFMLNDTFLLGRFCAPEVLADYRVAYTLPGCVNLISSAIGIFVGPYFVRNEDNLPWIRRKFKLVYGASAAAVGAACLGIGLLAKPVVWLLYGEQYLNIVPVMRLLLLAAFFNCALRYTTANLLAAMGQVKYNMLVSAAGMALQIGINLYVVPRYGATGVALTSSFVYLFMAAVLMVVFLRKYFRKA